ncbi:MAG: type II toxin-antitoxin system VapC family toxin [Candidatus Eremiobacterota bacterium]
MNKGILDTNIILKHIIQDDPVQSKRATELFKDMVAGKYKFYITSITFAELVWVLESIYKFTREEICNILKPLFNTDNLDFENREVLQETLILYKSLRVDYADCYNVCFARQNGIYEVYSFDKDYEKIRFVNRATGGINNV